MNLIDVYADPRAPLFLWQLLAERGPEVNISHRKMPTWEEHLTFFNSRPYEHWYLAEVNGQFVGATYLTQAREIGIFILKAHQAKGYGPWAVQKIIEMHPGKCYANISPQNQRSVVMFRQLGFKELQHTYLLEGST